MAKMFEAVKPGDLITADIFNNMADAIEKLNERVNAIERTATGTITGTIKDAETRSPIIGATIYAICGNVTYTSNQTDSQGSYSITNLLPGIYRVWAEEKDYARSRMETASVSAASTSTCNFLLSTNINRVEVPDIQGMPLSAAITFIRNRGLIEGLILDTHNNIIDPTDGSNASLLVINQSPSPGDPVPAGTSINLFMAVHAEVVLPPIIFDIKPNMRKVGETVEIIGIGFGSQKGKVTFAGVDAPIDAENWAADNITVKVPTGVPTGTIDVQVKNINAVKSNTFSFTVQATDGCTVGCTASCTASCTTGCTSGCTTKCTASCTTGCTLSCTSGRISCLKDICVKDLQPYCPKDQFCVKDLQPYCPKDQFCVKDLQPYCPKDQFCLKELQPYCPKDQPYCLKELQPFCQMDVRIKCTDIGDRIKNPVDNVLVEKGLDVTITTLDTTLPVTGEIMEGNIKIEADRGFISSGTEVTLEAVDGKEIKGNSLTSTGIGMQAVETVVKVQEADGTFTNYGGRLISGDGKFSRTGGITMEKGSTATVMVAGKAYTGMVADKVIIGVEKLDIGRKAGITKLTR